MSAVIQREYDVSCLRISKMCSGIGDVYIVACFVVWLYSVRLEVFDSIGIHNQEFRVDATGPTVPTRWSKVSRECVHIDKLYANFD